jgi:hypothetical protein
LTSGGCSVNTVCSRTKSHGLYVWSMNYLFGTVSSTETVKTYLNSRLLEAFSLWAKQRNAYYIHLPLVRLVRLILTVFLCFTVLIIFVFPSGKEETVRELLRWLSLSLGRWNIGGDLLVRASAVQSPPVQTPSVQRFIPWQYLVVTMLCEAWVCSL